MTFIYTGDLGLKLGSGVLISWVTRLRPFQGRDTVSSSRLASGRECKVKRAREFRDVVFKRKDEQGVYGDGSGDIHAYVLAWISLRHGLSDR